MQTKSRHQLNEDLHLVFANHGKEDKIHPLTTIEIAKAQSKDQELKFYYKTHTKTSKDDLCFQLIQNTIVLYKDEN